MALFGRLLNLSTGSVLLENFFTEIIAYLLSTEKEILYNWLKYLDLNLTTNYSASELITQASFKPLSSSPYNHSVGSRPDLVIKLVDAAGNRDIIFIESKIGATENPDQLKNYVEILHELPRFDRKFLLYITRDFDPKDEKDIFKNIPESTVIFKQIRWYEFHQFLQSQNDTTIVREVTTFMEKYQMVYNQFSEIDLTVLANINRSLTLMEETMWGEVSQKFEQILGKVTGKRIALVELKKNNRYIMFAYTKDKCWFDLGFRLKTFNVTEYPTICLTVALHYSPDNKSAVIRIMDNVCIDYDNWKVDPLNPSHPWVAISREKSLQDFLAEEDSVGAIKKFFLDAIIEAKKIKSSYLELL